MTDTSQTPEPQNQPARKNSVLILAIVGVAGLLVRSVFTSGGAPRTMATRDVALFEDAVRKNIEGDIAELKALTTPTAITPTPTAADEAAGRQAQDARGVQVPGFLHPSESTACQGLGHRPNCGTGVGGFTGAIVCSTRDGTAQDCSAPSSGISRSFRRGVRSSGKNPANSIDQLTVVGIGADIAELAESYGANVASYSRSATNTDVAKRADIVAAAADAGKRFGSIDFVVNTAGVLPRGELATVSEETIYSATEINYIAPVLIAQEFFPYLDDPHPDNFPRNMVNGFTAEGEATAHALGQALRARGKTVTRLARGVPVGSELEYVDLSTIAHALSDRR